MAANSRNKSKNDEYLRVVKSALSGFQRAALISISAAAYKAAVKATWQDSGQAAHNWQMAPGKEGHKAVDTTIGVDPVGRKGEQRSLNGSTDAVINDRMTAYGISEADNPTISSKVAGWVGDPTESGIFGVFTGYKRAKVQSVSVYNPLGPPSQGIHPFRAFLLHKSVDESIKVHVAQQLVFLQSFLNKKRFPRQALDDMMRTFYKR